MNSSRVKKISFPLLLASLPLAVVASGEIALRLFHYGNDYPLILQQEFRGKQYYTVSRAVAKRYFRSAVASVPEPQDDRFAVVKSDDTKRIFCLGESTMAGFPYEFNATAPSMLKDRLSLQYPQFQFEVINLGISAVSSYVLVDLMRELMNYQPDLIIVFSGHNEFYGIYGSGSSVYVGGNWLTSLHVRLLRFKLYQLVMSLVDSIRMNGSSAQQSRGTLMEQVVRNQHISYNSPIYRQTLQNYISNIRSMAELARSRSVAVMFSEFVSNERSQPPLQTSSALRRKEAPIDSSTTGRYFSMGTARYQRNSYDSARMYFGLARDYDELRFRASQEFLDSLRSVAHQLHIPLAPIDSAFRSASPHGIIDSTLLLEHLHPNITGYFLMAECFAKTIEREKLFAAQPMSVSDSACWSISGVTDFDWAVGRMKVEKLMRAWPFSTEHVDFIPAARRPGEEIVLRYVLGKLGWDQARFEMAEFYSNREKYELARAEAFAQSKVANLSYEPAMRLGDYSLLEKRIESAKSWYRISIRREENPFAHFKLGLALTQEDSIKAAREEFERAIALSSSERLKLSNEGLATAFYGLGFCNYRIGEYVHSKSDLESAVRLDPSNREARALLAIVRRK